MTAGVTLVLATAPFARTIYDCAFEDLASNQGWVPTALAVAYDDGEVQVADPMIQEVHGGPILVEPSTDSDGVLSLSWKLVLKDAGGGSLQVRYDLTIYKADNKVKIRAVPVGYDSSWSSRGRCEVTTD